MWAVMRCTAHKARSLVVIGIIFLFLSAANFSTYSELKEGRADRRYYEAAFVLCNDLRFWAVLFGIAGLVAIVSAFTKRYPLGFFATMLMTSWWAGLFAASLLMTGYPRIIPSILMWSLISVFLYIIASWPEMYNVADMEKEAVRLEQEYEK